MIRVEFKKPEPPDDFDDWVKRCGSAAKKLTGPEGISEKLYKEQRQLFLDLFHGKCAYCEAKIVLDQHNGDVEHFRPKGGVTDENDKVIEIENSGGRRQPHRGYYWLAYSWENLLPSCIACNRPNKLGDRRVGKWNRFPVVGKHASSRAELAQERPLLLNPLLARDDPAQHLQFDPDTGRIIGTTEQGRMTVFVLNLNREGLPEARRDVYDAARARIRDAIDAEMDGDFKKLERHMEFLIQHKQGAAEYSIAGRPVIVRYERTLQSQAQRLGASSRNEISLPQRTPNNNLALDYDPKKSHSAPDLGLS